MNDERTNGRRDVGREGLWCIKGGSVSFFSTPYIIQIVNDKCASSEVSAGAAADSALHHHHHHLSAHSTAENIINRRKDDTLSVPRQAASQ